MDAPAVSIAGIDRRERTFSINSVVTSSPKNAESIPLRPL
jgi:hypothetical protein